MRSVIFVGLVSLYAFVVVRICRIRIDRRATTLFLVAGLLLTVLRISLLQYLSYRMQTHTFSEAMSLLTFVMWPESTIMASIRQPNPTLDFLLTSALIALGSFLWALPTLLLWGVKER
jgi:hypothetical protein